MHTQSCMQDSQCLEYTGTVYGYARVSSRDQNLARQYDALKEFPVEHDNIFADKASGKDFNRPNYRKLLKQLRPGDIVVIKSIDRLGRNYNEIIDEWRDITRRRQAAIVVLDMPLLDTRGTGGGITGVFIADLMLLLLSYIAQIERENIHQRQAEGIAAAQARGVRFGRPQIERPASYPSIRDAYLAGRISRKEAAHMLNVSPGTFANWIRQDSTSAE